MYNKFLEDILDDYEDLGEQLYNKFLELITENIVYSNNLNEASQYYSKEYNEYIYFDKIPTKDDIEDLFIDNDELVDNIFEILQNNLYEAYTEEDECFFGNTICNETNPLGIAVEYLLQGVEEFCYSFADEYLEEMNLYNE